MQKIIERKITIKQDGQLLINTLSEQTALSKQVLKSALDKGCVWLKSSKKTNRIRRVKKPLKIGNEVYIYFNEKILSLVPETPELILDKKDYSIWFKPAGVFSQGSKWGDHCALTRLVEKSLNRNSFLVHRLDRATSGLMIIAHTKTLARDLSDMFAQRKINKNYIAIVEGKFPDKEIHLDGKIDGKRALSHIKKLQEDADKSLLFVTIETGRKHQIRKHLSKYEYPIIGDRIYGGAKAHDKDLQLQAIQLIFNCPIDKTLVNIELDEKKRLHL